MRYFTRLSPPNGISIGLAGFLHSSPVCPTHTDTQTMVRPTSVAVYSMYATHAMRPNKNGFENMESDWGFAAIKKHDATPI